MSSDVAGLALQDCLAQGVREFVVCAGARNAPLVLALARCDGVTVWNHFEERAAGFFALGRIMDGGRPVAVVTTSGTAAAELLPSLIEAHYQGRPLVAVTADRPRRFRGSGAPQAIEQSGIFGDYVEGCDDREDEDGAFFEGWSGLRPWHLNLCLEEEVPVPELVGPGEVPPPAHPKRPGVSELVSFLRGDEFRGLVVMAGGLEPDEQKPALHLIKDLGAPVIADATSGLRELIGSLALADGDALLRSVPPGKILRLGDVPVGRFWRDLEELPDVSVCSVTRTGFSGLARESLVIPGRVDDAVRGMGGASAVGDALDLLAKSAKRSGRLEELLERYPDSEPALVRLLSTYATIGESLFLGNSLPIREWNLCAQSAQPIAVVRANRGANGIDGQLATWIGATADEEGAWAVVGDLTALYDLSAPALLEGCAQAGRILTIINNGGGRIFERLPRLAGIAEAEQDLMANAHATGFASWAEMWGFDYSVVTDRDSFEIDPGERMLVVEIRPDPEQTEAFWNDWR